MHGDQQDTGYDSLAQCLSSISLAPDLGAPNPNAQALFGTRERLKPTAATIARGGKKRHIPRHDHYVERLQKIEEEVNLRGKPSVCSESSTDLTTRAQKTMMLKGRMRMTQPPAYLYHTRAILCGGVHRRMASIP